jgi:hypothetical protein
VLAPCSSHCLHLVLAAVAPRSMCAHAHAAWVTRGCPQRLAMLSACALSSATAAHATCLCSDAVAKVFIMQNRHILGAVAHRVAEQPIVICQLVFCVYISSKQRHMLDVSGSAECASSLRVPLPAHKSGPLLPG